MKMAEESPLQLPAGAGAAEGLGRGERTIAWFGDQQRQADVVYVADGRIVALHGGTDAAMASAYGEWQDGIVARTTRAGDPARFLAGQWLSSGDLVGGSLLARALERFFPGSGDDLPALQIDDRAVLGLGGVTGAATLDARHWAAAVAGELTLPGLAEPIALRPALATLQDDVLALEEPGIDPGPGAPASLLTLTLALGRDGQPAGPAPDRVPAIALESAVALLLDEKLDGAWERPSPLWLPTSGGLLRIEQGDMERAPYLFSSESRNIDVRRWFPALPAGAQARLMLDRSGPKKLSAVDEGHRIVLTLEVRWPALVLVLPGMAIDGRVLPAPRLPPGAAALDQALPLQLVPPHLCGGRASPWQLACGADMRLRWQRPDDGDGPPGLTHFMAHDNWVLPPEAARNDAPGISALRVLVPMLPDGREQAFVLRAEAGSAGAPAMLLEALGTFGTMAPEALDFGPLAGFDAAAGPFRELWPALPAAPAPAAEPAVLRSVYRMLPPGVAAEGVPASYEATRVRPGAPVPAAEPPASAVTAAERPHQTRAYRPGSQQAEVRHEDATAWPGKRFGWDDRQFLESAGFAEAGLPAPDPALAWAELPAPGSAATTTRWIRLGDDSLTPLATPVPVPAPGEAAPALWPALWPDIVLETPSLADDDPAQVRWGLAQLAVTERIAGGTSAFTLAAGTARAQVPVEVQHYVNRVVVAGAPATSVVAGIAQAVTTASLNRIYLELERRGGRLVVMRAMLGWSASRAFGLPRKDAGTGPDFHVTERFERVDGVLRRSAEYNGVLSRQVDVRHAVDLYFWDVLQEEATATLRVICHYRINLGGTRGTTSICALQDAALDGDALDLAADIAILRAPNEAQVRRLSYPWDPDRRKLFRLLFDTAPVAYEFGGFLRVRAAAADNVQMVPVDHSAEARVVPAWFLCDRDLVPWFDGSNALPAAQRDSWTAEGLLRSAPPGEGQGKLAIQLYSVGNFNLSKWYASTLIGTLGEAAGIPLWVPSPVRVPEDGKPPGKEAAADGVLRLWLFNPGPRMVAQWQLPAGTEDGQRLAQGRQDAAQRLWRMGWTREAVLELPRPGAADQVDWVVVDSPLLNRGASLSWFGWPLAPGAELPQDALPATRQAPQSSAGGQHSFSVQVEFEKDGAPGPGGANLVYRSAYPDIADAVPEGLTFRSAGIRLEVGHKLLAYGTQAPQPLVTPPLAMPPQVPGGSLRVQGSRLVWQTESVDLAQAGLLALPGGVLLYSVPEQYGELQAAGFPPGLQWQDGAGTWTGVAAGAWLPLAPAAAGTRAIRLKLPAPARWHTLTVTLRKAGGDPAGEIRTLFPAGGTRLAGVFDEAGKLLAFGEESAAYAAPEFAPGSPPEQGSGLWTRETGVTLPPRQAARARRVVTIDLDGRSVVHA
ncbi:hypothetical protein [Herbaspirillum sp. SJZ107]|uniref:hypothetical protein n=1 Tax=Herbaspirillum sp. SJZ107 TaxID=2572881 RepID=UPI00114F4C54|nr:hypothetical protein [Herbaspirillum sp. SJZ107]TQK03560.1 hypothetical protein FBX97_5132 [Herbaspirillum sp. SJZ107]